MGPKMQICVCLLAAYAMSTIAFSEDEVVPETALTLSLLSTRHPELKHASPKDAADAKIKMMQAQGFDKTQCNKMATDAITGMISTLKVEQDAVDALSTGEDCVITTPATRRLLSTTPAQQDLDETAAALVAAKTDLATKEATLQASRAASIDLPLAIFLGTDYAMIAAVAADPDVVAAKQAVATAQTAMDAANVVVAAAQATYDTTFDDAQESSQQCLCNAKTAHDLAWTGAQKIKNDSTSAWKEAHHIKCAVAGTADGACSVPDFAVADNKPLVAKASSADCGSPAPTIPPIEVAPTEVTPKSASGCKLKDVTHNAYLGMCGNHPPNCGGSSYNVMGYTESKLSYRGLWNIEPISTEDGPAHGHQKYKLKDSDHNSYMGMCGIDGGGSMYDVKGYCDNYSACTTERGDWVIESIGGGKYKLQDSTKNAYLSMNMFPQNGCGGSTYGVKGYINSELAGDQGEWVIEGCDF